MDDLTLKERVRLIEEFERNKPQALQVAAKRAVILLVLAAGVLGLLIVGGIRTVTQLEEKQTSLRTEIDTLNGQKEQALKEMNEATQQRNAVLDLAGVPTDPGTRVPRLELIGLLYSRNANERLRAYGELVATSRRDPTVVPELLRFAASNAGADRANGIYNTLVLLSHLDADTLVPHADEVRRFANDMRSAGPRTAARAETLIARLPPA